MNEVRLQTQDTETASPNLSLDGQVLSSILVSLKFQASETRVNADEAHTRLLELLQSPAIKALLLVAEKSARAQGLTPEQGLTNVIQVLKEIDVLWSQILLKEGLAHLSTQFH